MKRFREFPDVFTTYLKRRKISINKKQVTSKKWGRLSELAIRSGVSLPPMKEGKIPAAPKTPFMKKNVAP